MTELAYKEPTMNFGDPSVLGRWWRTVDKVTLGALIILLMTGMLIGFAASPPLAAKNNLADFHYVYRHAVFACMAVGGLLFLSVWTPDQVRRNGVRLFALALIALLLLPVFGTDFGKGAVRWYSLGFTTVQPVEFLKPVFVVTAAWLMSAAAQPNGPPGVTISMVFAGGIALAGANIIDARIHTATNGFAIDNFLVQDLNNGPFGEASQIARLKKGIHDALFAQVELVPKLAARPLSHSRAKAFAVAPTVNFDNKASNRFTVIEVTARDRPALLNRLAHALFTCNLIVHSAHIIAYGESAADTFYVTDLTGSKVTLPQRLAEIEAVLLEASSDERQLELEQV